LANIIVFVNFLYYGIMATAVKHDLPLTDMSASVGKFLDRMSWDGYTDFRRECVSNWRKLFATNDVVYTENIICNFLSFIDHMSCSVDTYVSLGGSNGCTDQLTNWYGTQKVGLDSINR